MGDPPINWYSIHLLVLLNKGLKGFPHFRDTPLRFFFTFPSRVLPGPFPSFGYRLVSFDCLLVVVGRVLYCKRFALPASASPVLAGFEIYTVLQFALK